MATFKELGERIYGRGYTPSTPPRAPPAPASHISHRIYPDMKRVNQPPTTTARSGRRLAYCCIRGYRYLDQ